MSVLTTVLICQAALPTVAGTMSSATRRTPAVRGAATRSRSRNPRR